MKSVIPCPMALLVMLASSAVADVVIEVDAGKHDRVDTPIRVELPKDSGGISHYYNLEALDTHKLRAWRDDRSAELISTRAPPLPPAGSQTSLSTRPRSRLRTNPPARICRRP